VGSLCFKGLAAGATSMPLFSSDPIGPCLYSDRDLDSIIEATGGSANVGRESLARLLSTALLGYTELSRGKEIIERRDWERKKYKKMQQCCKTLLDAIDDLGDCLDAGRPMDLNDVRQLVRQCHDWAQWQSGLRSEVENTRGRDWRSSDFAMDTWIKVLAEIYRLVFGKEPGFSVNDGRVTGPFARYLDACIRPVLGNAPGPEALRSRWQRLAKESDSSGQCP
jgi:hypothetical protein